MRRNRPIRPWHAQVLALVSAVIAMMALAAALAGAPARAEDDPLPTGGASYLTLYPTGDIYQVQIIGDYIAEGLKGGLVEAFRADTRIQVRSKTLDFPTLMRPDFNDHLKSLDAELGKDTPPIAVVMFGPQDRTSIRVGSKRYWIDSDEWREEFARQADAVMKALKRRKIAVYWVSLPNVRRTEPNEDVQVINEIIREKAVLNGFRYIDAYAGFTDEGGGYNAMGPDLTGKIRLLREQNGIGFTDAGNRKLAHFVEREMKRDLTQAKRDRVIPLAGNETEQAAIAAARQAQQAQAARAAANAAAVAAGQTLAAGPLAPLTAGAGDQKADSGRISLAVTASGGREEIVSVDLLRPSIPATVIELVSKKEVAEKPTNLGDLLIDKIPGGLIVMSSISPAADPTGTARSRLPPTQTTYFRVMVKGERLPVRADRADDIGWPRAEPPPLAAETVAPPSAPAATPAPAAPARKDAAPRGKRAEGEPPVRVR